jgi:two-component system NarL family sensor kinase
MATVPAFVVVPRPVRSGGRSWVRALACCLAVGAVLAPLIALTAPSGHSDWKAVLAPWLFAVPGVLVALGRPRNVLGWLMLSVACIFAGSVLAASLIGTELSDAPAAWAVWFVDRASALIVPLTLAVLLLLPDGRMPSRAWGWTAGAALALQVAIVVAWSLTTGPAAAPDTDLVGVGHLPNPVGVLPRGTADVVTALEPVLQGLLLVAVPAVVWRLRRGSGEDRRRLASVLGAVLVFALLVVVGRLAWPAMADLLDVVGCALLAAALTSAVLRRRLPGVEVVVGHALVYSVLTGLVAGAYVLAVAALGRFGSGMPPAAVGVLAAVVALALLPLRAAVQRAVHRALFGDTADAATAIRNLSATAARSTTLDDLLDTVARTVRSSLRATRVVVTADGHTAAAGPGPGPPGAVHHQVLLVRGEPRGQLTVTYPPGRRFARRDRDLLQDFADHVGRVVETVLLTDEVRASREALVMAREEERLRLRRDLHDELGPTLAGLRMELAGLGELIARDPATATRRAAHLRESAGSALESVRSVSRGLRPVALDDLGLVGALAEVADRCGVDLRVDATGLPPLSAAVEVAAYRIGAEALTNVGRHAGVSAAELVLRTSPCHLSLQVVDHGRGRGAARAGVGSLSMRERAEELGGTLDVMETPGGGTTVRARLPIPDHRARQGSAR